MRKLRHEEIPRPDPEAIQELPRHPVTAVLENIRSIYNVGSIFRTADAARIEHLYLTGYTGTPEHPRLHKTALGAQETVPWSKDDDPRHVLNILQQDDYSIAALEITDSPTPISSLSLEDFPLCLVVGNELHGVSDELVEQADFAFEIEQFGAKQSLNVSVAFGVAVFDLVRRYRFLVDNPPPRHI